MSVLAAYQKKLDELRVAFDNADKDNNGKLTEEAFKQFVQLGFKKPCPDGMYGYLCDHFAVSKSDGLSWDNALQIWKQSNPPPKGADNFKAKTPQPQQPNTINNNVSNSSNSNNSMTASSKSPTNMNGNDSQPSINSIGRSQTERTRGRNINLGDDALLSDNGGNGGKRTRSPSPNGDRAIVNHRRDTSLSGSVRRNGNRSYKDLSSHATNALNNNPTSPNVNSDIGGSGHSRAFSNSMDSESDSHEISRSTSLQRGNHRRDTSNSLRRTKTLLGPTLERRTSNNNMMNPGDDASSMVVQMLEQKLKTSSTQLKDEKKKRKKADETVSNLLTQNEKLKQKLSETESKCKKLGKELKKFEDDSKKFKGQVDDDRNAMTHLTTQLKSIKEERDEAMKLIRKMEEQSAQHLAKLKRDHMQQTEMLRKKHTEEIERQSNGFLQTLGVDPSSGKGVREVIKELKDGNENLAAQVDMLAETLARKEASLLHALQVLDELNQTKSRRNSNTVDELKQDYHSKLSKKQSIAENFKNNVIQGLAKNKAQGINHTPNGHSASGMNGNANFDGNNNNNSKAKSPLPAPPVNRRKFSNPKPMHNADFYRHASSPRYYGTAPQLGNATQFHKNSRLNNGKTNVNDIQGSTKTKEKSMEMLNNSLVSDVVNKQDAIDDLKTANNTLVDQVMNLQRQLDDMHRSSQKFMKKNNMQPNASKTNNNNSSNTNNNSNNNNSNNNNNKKTNNEQTDKTKQTPNGNSNNINTSNRSRGSTQESEDLP